MGGAGSNVERHPLKERRNSFIYMDGNKSESTFFLRPGCLNGKRACSFLACPEPLHKRSYRSNATLSGLDHYSQGIERDTEFFIVQRSETLRGKAFRCVFRETDFDKLDGGRNGHRMDFYAISPSRVVAFGPSHRPSNRASGQRRVESESYRVGN